MHLGLQGVALLVDNVGKTKLDTHNLGDKFINIFTFKNPITLTFPLENEYVDCTFFAILRY